MKSRGKTLTAILAGGVLLASTAYGIGTQVGGGGATAADDSSPRDQRREMRIRMDRGERFGRAALARKLGVSEERLRTALEEIRGEMKRPGDRRDRMVADLAEALGVSTDRVRAALEKLRPRMERRHRGDPRRFAAALAKELGIEASKVREAFRGFRRGRNGPPTPAELAQRLGISEAALKAALEKVRPSVPRRVRGKRPGGRFAAALANELDLEVADVRAALRKLHSRRRAEHEARREAFARTLAEKLDIPVAKVRAALPKRGPGQRGFRGRMHRRFGGPGGPAGPPGMARPGSFAPGGPPPGPEGGGLKF